MDLLSIYNGMHGAVDVKKQTMFPSVPGQRCVRRESTSDVVVHDDRYSKLREVQPTTQTLVHGSAIVLRGESQLGFDRSAE